MGTLAYLAPEVCTGEDYKGFSSDIWGAGIVLYCMLYGKIPFKANSAAELKEMIIKV